MLKNIVGCYKNSFDFAAYADRNEFLSFVLFQLLIFGLYVVFFFQPSPTEVEVYTRNLDGVILSLVREKVVGPNSFGNIATDMATQILVLFWALSLPAFMAVQFRRLNDLDRSGWFMLAVLFPPFYLILFVFFLWD